MKYKGILLDIDNTLYSYSEAHHAAVKSIVNYFINEFNLNEKIIISSYENARKKVHIDLIGTASSHNRLLYIQKMCEFFEINPLKYSYKIFNLYMDNYLNNLKPYDGVYDLLHKYKNNICLITDLTSDIQYRKIEALKLNNYCKTIVTSEEAGNEKPHSYIFMLALLKLNLNNHEVCMIGDNFDKDIVGANNLNIDAIWFNHNKNDDSNYNYKNIKIVSTFKEILKLV